MTRRLLIGSAIAVATVALAAHTVVHAQAPGTRRTGPSLQAAQDPREPEVLATCRTPPPARGGGAGRAGGAQGGEGRGAAAAPAGNPMARDYTVAAIPGVIAAGQRWRMRWQGTGNNADGILGIDDGSMWIAQNDDSAILKVDKDGKTSVIFTGTNTGGAVARTSNGVVYVASRGLNPAILQVAPERRILANMYQGEPLDCIGGTMHDLVVDTKGRVYFALGDPAFYVKPSGEVMKYGDASLRGNGIILSPDEKRLYITSGPSLVVFDVQPDGTLANQREFARWTGGAGDGLCVDAAGRIYVSGETIRVIGTDGKELGTIPTPFQTSSVAFGGPDKKTLFAVGGAAVNGERQVQLIAIQMTAQGDTKRAK